MSAGALIAFLAVLLIAVALVCGGLWLSNLLGGVLLIFGIFTGIAWLLMAYELYVALSVG